MPALHAASPPNDANARKISGPRFGVVFLCPPDRKIDMEKISAEFSYATEECSKCSNLSNLSCNDPQLVFRECSLSGRSIKTDDPINNFINDMQLNDDYCS